MPAVSEIVVEEEREHEHDERAGLMRGPQPHRHAEQQSGNSESDLDEQRGLVISEERVPCEWRDGAHDRIPLDDGEAGALSRVTPPTMAKTSTAMPISQSAIGRVDWAVEFRGGRMKPTD